MTAPMTPREAEIRKQLADAPGSFGNPAVVRDLLDEIDRLRALPVIPTCGDCGWQTSALSKKRAVIHVCRKSKSREIDLSTAPPTWCELRGAR